MFRSLAFFLLLWVFVSPSKATTAAVDHPGSLPILLANDKVRAELKLDSLQRALLDSLRSEYKSAARKVASASAVANGERSLAEKQLRQLNERFNRRALSMLSETQREKLFQMERRFLGVTMVYTPSVQATLGLTGRQKKQVEDIREKGLAYVGKINRKFERGKISQQQRLQLLRNRRTSQGSEIFQVLTPEQRNKVLVLTGRKVES